MKTLKNILIITGIIAYILAILNDQGVFDVKTIIVDNSAAILEDKLQEEANNYDPCGLKDVYCEGEEQKEVKKPIQSVEEIKKEIKRVFGEENGEKALKIAKCESQFDPTRVGDKHIMAINKETGEMVGDSIGLFQIRTGAENWNRAARNGMSADDFRELMHNPKENIKYAKAIFDRRGWEGWHNCAVKTLAYK